MGGILRDLVMFEISVKTWEKPIVKGEQKNWNILLIHDQILS